MGRDVARMQVDLMHAPQATGEIRYTGLEAVKKECDDFRRALDAAEVALRRAVHDRGFARNRRGRDAQRALSEPA